MDDHLAICLLGVMHGEIEHPGTVVRLEEIVLLVSCDAAHLEFLGVNTA